MDKALEAAVTAYDDARCKAHGGDKPMSERNRDTIAPMIEAAITAYLAALPATDTSGLVKRLRDEAQMWKMEAMAHKSSLHEAYQACSGATGEPGNWNGAEPIKATIASLTDHIETLEREQAEAEAVIRQLEDANDLVAAGRSQTAYLAMIDGGQADALNSLDIARSAARSYLEGRK